MKHALFAALALSLLGCVSSCGFQPLYADGQATGRVTVEQIDGRTGQALRKALIQELGPGLPGLEGEATLTVILDENLARLALRPDEAASRTDVIGKAEYVLATADTAISGEIRAETAYNVPNAPFSDITAQIDAGERLMTVLARRLVDDIRLKMAGAE
ncbi:MAG: hypothetical protein AAGH90_12490 [Pseudomonadota bacterium]